MTLLRITAFVFAGLWALGTVTSTFGGFVHVLAVVAVVLLVVEFFTKRRIRN